MLWVLAKLQNPSVACLSSGQLFFPVMSADYLSVGQCPERGQEWLPCAPSWALHPSGGVMSVCWHLGLQNNRGGRAGRGGAMERIWNTLRCRQGQLVNFVGMHLVERRCINIRSLSADCVSHLGGGGAGRPQMPFVKKTRMASRSPWKVTSCPRAVLRVRAQNLGKAEVAASPACPGCPW